MPPKIKKSLPEQVNTNDGTKLLFIWFRALGIVMPKRLKVIYIIYSLSVNFLSIICTPLTFILSYFIDTNKMELTQFLTSLQVGINDIACALKFASIIYMRRNLFKIEAILMKLDTRMKYPEEFLEVHKTIRFGNRAVLFYFVLYYTYATSTTLGAVYRGRPPYSLYIPFLNWRDSYRNFVFVSIIEYFLINVACFQDVPNDTYAIIYINIIHTHVKNLILRIEKLLKNGESKPGENKKELIKCIYDHKNIVNLINAVAPVISPTVFIQFLVSAAALGTTLINIAISVDKSNMLGSFFFVGVVVSQTLPLCYFINCLVAEGRRIPTAIFHMNWLEQDMEFRRICIFFMHRTQQEPIFIAGNLFPITLDTFVSIIKLSFSVYTIMSQMDFTNKIH